MKTKHEKKESMVDFMSKDPVLDFMDAHIKDHMKLRSLFDEDNRYGFDWPLQDLFKRMKMILLSQSYGLRIQNKVSEILGAKSLSNRDKKGDLLTDNGNIFEFKVGYYSKGCYSFLQIRPWDKFGHIFLAVHPDYTHTLFYLTVDQMQDEIRRCGMVCHGHTPLKAFRLYPSGKKKDRLDRWMSTYTVASFKKLKQIIS